VGTSAVQIAKSFGAEVTAVCSARNLATARSIGLSTIGSQKMGLMRIASPNQKDWVTVKELVEAGKIAPVSDRSYPLADAAEAMR